MAVSDITIGIDVNSADTDAVCARLIALLSPPGLEEFMHVGPDQILHERIAQRFDNEGDDVVGQWAQLRPSTVAIRTAKGFDGAHPINRRTGEMYDFLMEPGRVGSDKGGTALQIPGRAASGELFDKIKTAQVGRRTPPVTGRRRVLGMNEKDAEAILERFNTWIIGEFARTGHDVPVS